MLCFLWVLSMIKININDYIKVKLTEYGKSVYNDYFKKYNIDINVENKLDKDGYLTDQIHSIVNIFGKYLVMGTPLVFETNMMYDENQK